MREDTESLNKISHDAAIKMIEKLSSKYSISSVFVDTVGPPEKYQRLLANKFSYLRNTKFVVEKKADSLFKVVSAASIVAKVKRDELLENWKFEEKGTFKTNFGCGYPGDKITKKWLRDNCDKVFGLPSIARYSWSTTEVVMKELCVPIKIYSPFEEVEIQTLIDMNFKIRKTKPITINRDYLYKDFETITGLNDDFDI